MGRLENGEGAKTAELPGQNIVKLELAERQLPE